MRLDSASTQWPTGSGRVSVALMRNTATASWSGTIKYRMNGSGTWGSTSFTASGNEHPTYVELPSYNANCAMCTGGCINPIGVCYIEYYIDTATYTGCTCGDFNTTTYVTHYRPGN